MRLIKRLLKIPVAKIESLFHCFDQYALRSIKPKNLNGKVYTLAINVIDNITILFT